MHTTGGDPTQVRTRKYVFDLQPGDRRVLVHGRRGWVTGHSYIVYGPLAAGATI